MIIGIDISPLKTGHQFRGTGSYTDNLTQALKKYDPENDYKFFTLQEKLPANLDLIHYPYFEPFFLTLPLKKLLPTIVTIHDLTPLVFPNHFPRGVKGEIKWQIQKRSLKGVAAVIVDSKNSQKDVTKYTSIPEEKIFVVYLAAGEEFRQLKPEELIKIKIKYSLPEKFVLYIGDATWNKNVPGLVRAIQKINLPLVLIGKKLAESDFDRRNPWNNDLLKVEKLTYGDKKIFKLGFIPQEDLVGIYNLATVCVQPSFYEGFGLPVLEAMSCGCPVITSKGGSLPEVAGDAAFYIDPYDIDDMANGVGEIYFNTPVQERFRKVGFLQAKKFSWKKTAEETVKVYKQVLRQH